MRTARTLVLTAVALLLPAASSSAETVTTLANSGPGSLRAAIANAAPGTTIGFQPGLAGTIELADVLEVDKDLRIDGPGARDLAISGMDVTRVLHVFGDGTEVEIDDVTIRDGVAPAGDPFGGGLLVTGGDSIRLSRVAVLDNEARGTSPVPLGGGIAIVAGELDLVDSTVAGNRADGGGGGGLVVGVPFEIVNSTVAGNGSLNGAGLLALHGSGTVRHSTFAGNTAAGVGHTIGAWADAAVTVERSLLAGNGSAAQALCDGPVADGGGNVYDALCFGAGDAVAEAPVGPLTDNGGPTDTVLPLLGNPALDRIAGTCLPSDQRGIARPSGPACDAGAVEARGARVEAAGALALGTVTVGGRSAGSTSITNTGEVAAAIAAIAVTGPDAAEVELGAGTCGDVLEPGDSCTVEAVLAPASAGSKSAAIAIDLAAPARGIEVAVTGTGAAPAVDPPSVIPVDPPPAAAPLGSATTTLLGVSTRARTGGKFTVRLRCETVTATHCAGALRLKLGGRRLSRAFTIAAGRKAVVRLRLSRGDRRRLAKRRSLRSVVTVVTTQPDGSRKTTHRSALKLLRARRR